MPRDAAYLLDIALAARRALRFTQGRTWEEFEADELLQNAVLWPLQVIGEAARRVSEGTKAAYPQIPWAEMVGMRNRLVHEYSAIDVAEVWGTVQRDLAGLIAQIEPLLEPEDRS